MNPTLNSRVCHFPGLLLVGAGLASGCLPWGVLGPPGDALVPVRIEPGSVDNEPITADVDQESGDTPRHCEFVPCNVCLSPGAALIQIRMKPAAQLVQGFAQHVSIPETPSRVRLSNRAPGGFVAALPIVASSVPLIFGAIETGAQSSVLTTYWWMDPHWKDKAATLQGATIALGVLSAGTFAVGMALILTNMKWTHIEVVPWRRRRAETPLLCRDKAAAPVSAPTPLPPARPVVAPPVPSARPEMLLIRAATDPFLIDKTEVTVDQYGGCIQKSRCTKPDGGELCTFGRLAHGRHPVTCVSQAQAAAYCEFAGKRLPRDDEWQHLLFQYGDSARATPRSTAQGGVGPAQAGTFAAAYGLADLVGNVWQWSENPAGMSWGGSWDSQTAKADDLAQLHNAVAPEKALPTVGFRCAADR